MLRSYNLPLCVLYIWNLNYKKSADVQRIPTSHTNIFVPLYSAIRYLFFFGVLHFMFGM